MSRTLASTRAFLLTVGRPPDGPERDAARRFLEAQPARYPGLAHGRGSPPRLGRLLPDGPGQQRLPLCRVVEDAHEPAR